MRSYKRSAPRAADNRINLTKDVNTKYSEASRVLVLFFLIDRASTRRITAVEAAVGSTALTMIRAAVCVYIFHGSRLTSL